jgi:predicted O-methyltransferase YrrM
MTVEQGTARPQVTAPGLDFVRAVEGEALASYLAGTRLLRAVGNDVFARLLALERADLLSAKALDVVPFPGSTVLYHSWRPGFQAIRGLDPADARRALSASPKAGAAHGQELRTHLRERAWDDTEMQLGLVADKAIQCFCAQQNRVELHAFLARVIAARPTVVVEIGTARGGLLFGLAHVADPAATLISIDLPGGSASRAFRTAERAVFSSFARPQQTIDFIVGDSHAAPTRAQLCERLGTRAIDLLFIDGDHSYEGVRRDYELYAPLVSAGGLIALHDICVRADQWPQTRTLAAEPPDVGRFWAELSTGSGSSVIVDPAGVCGPVRPQGVSCAWGIGLIHV